MARRPATVYGLRAALALGRHRPEAIQRILYDVARRDDLRPLLKAAAQHRRPYNEAGAEDLAKVAGTLHHEGVVVTADPLLTVPFPQLLGRLPADAIVVALDGVSNPHNIGSVLRSAAWFGVAAVLIDGPEDEALNPAAIRVAQGGAEVVPVSTAEVPRALEALARRGFTIVGADQRASANVFDAPLARPTCLVLGSEADGLSKASRRACTLQVAVPGTAAVESLNVGVAAGILMAAATRTT